MEKWIAGILILGLMLIGSIFIIYSEINSLQNASCPLTVGQAVNSESSSGFSCVSVTYFYQQLNPITTSSNSFQASNYLKWTVAPNTNYSFIFSLMLSDSSASGLSTFSILNTGSTTGLHFAKACETYITGIALADDSNICISSFGANLGTITLGTTNTVLLRIEGAIATGSMVSQIVEFAYKGDGSNGITINTGSFVEVSISS